MIFCVPNLLSRFVEPVRSERDDTNAEDATVTNDPGQFDYVWYADNNDSNDSKEIKQPKIRKT
jgi:hypothetical protein